MQSLPPKLQKMSLRPRHLLPKTLGQMKRRKKVKYYKTCYMFINQVSLLALFNAI
uniref:Uncharacterized protein n=1 Tax=Anguilla anguilla TaxID=7936 RepID=A0A0E9TKR5_ANGAN